MATNGRLQHSTNFRKALQKLIDVVAGTGGYQSQSVMLSQTEDQRLDAVDQVKFAAGTDPTPLIHPVN